MGFTLAELEKLLDVPFVIWFCPKGCRGRVEWNKEATIARCLKCGSQSKTDSRNTIQGSTPGIENTGG